MAPSALMQLQQGATVGGNGEALFGTTGTAVTVLNVVNTDVASWLIELLHVPPDSALSTGTLASGNDANPTASFTPDVRGPYRLRLTVWRVANQHGTSDVDIRNFGVKEANGFYRPAPQLWPRPLPPVASGESGAKPDENNFGGQANGWAGTGSDGLLDHFIKAAAPLVMDGIATGTVQLSTFPAASLPDGTTARVKSLRREFYLDLTSSATAVSGSIVAASGGGRWIARPLGDCVWQEQAEWFYDASGGALEAIGTRAAPIASVAELARRVSNGGATASTLYTAAELTDAEHDLFDRLTKHSPKAWRICNGGIPTVPILDYDAANIDGQNNATLTNGQSLAAVPWRNLSSLGSTGDLTTIFGAPTYKAVASAGKLRESPSVAFPGSAYFRRAIAGLETPITWIVIAMVTDRAAHNTIVDGSDGSNRNALMTFSSLWQLYSGSLVTPLGFTQPTSGTYNYLHVSYPSNAAVFAANGVVHDASPPLAHGTQMVAGVTIGAGGPDDAMLTGEVVRLIVLDGEENKVDATAFNDYIEYHYGSGFPQ
jgi:hypothetical protein